MHLSLLPFWYRATRTVLYWFIPTNRSRLVSIFFFVRTTKYYIKKSEPFSNLLNLNILERKFSLLLARLLVLLYTGKPSFPCIRKHLFISSATSISIPISFPTIDLHSNTVTLQVNRNLLSF
jgi:hypothetical protein